MVQASQPGVEIWTADKTIRLFILGGVETFSYSDEKNPESLDVPGIIWNSYFDSIIVNSRLTITGKAKCADQTWDSVNSLGRSFDFIHQLRSVLKTIGPTTGTDTGENYSCFRILCNITLASGTYYYEPTSGAGYYTAPDGKTGAFVFYAFLNGEYKIIAGSPLLVEYTLTFLEIAGATASDALIRLG